MIQIFISHAGPDAAIAEMLAVDLRNAGHDTRIDTRELKLGDDSIDFMNSCIADAHVVLILHSANTAKAVWQKMELNAAIWNETAQSGGKCIVLRLDDAPIPPLLGPRIYGCINPADKSSYQSLLERLCGEILPEKPVSSIVSEAFSSESQNPFRRVRAEYFEDQPELLARTFTPPDALKMGALEDIKPCFLEGSRGTGKSMLLMSLRARNFSRRAAGESNPHRVFGFYLKLSRGAVCNVGMFADPNTDPQKLSDLDAAQVADIAAQEIVVCLVESLLSELSFCIKQRTLICDPTDERRLAESIQSALFGNAGPPSLSIEDLLDRLADTHRDVASFIRRRFIYCERPTVPVAAFDIEALKRLFVIIRRHVPLLKHSMFVALLDEYENLFPYQQRVINGFIKFAAPQFSVKVAKKLGSSDISGTSSGQELQETHDYTRLPLVYDVEDSTQLGAYHDLLKHMIANLLRAEGFSAVSATDLLPADQNPEVADDLLQEQVGRLTRLTPAELDALPVAKRREKMTYYREAAIYRTLYGTKGRRILKQFSGFSELAFLSSGVIRYFQELLSVGYHLTYGSGNGPSQQIVIPPDKQSQAVHFVSEHNLTTLSRNVETHGEQLKYFLLDLGDCLRHKLLKHTSEPEAARITIEDPELLGHPELSILKRLLDVGVREGVFQTREGRPAFRPKHSSDPEPTEFNVCRIFAPVLQISPRLRWRTKMKARTLAGLLTPDQRARTLRQIKLDWVKSDEPTSQQPGLFQ